MFQTPPFTEHEFQRRYERAWERMEEDGLDAIVAYSAGNQFWLSGYLGSLSAKRFPEFSHDVLFPKIVLPRGEAPVMVGFQMPAETYANESHIRDIRPVGVPVEATRPAAIRAVLEAHGISSGRIGLDFDAYGSIKVSEFQNLREELGAAELVDATDLLYRLRMIKSAAEISYLRTAVEIQNNAFRKFVRRIGRGISETELMFTMFECQAEAGATEVGIAMPWTHPGYTFFRSQYPDRLMVPGDFQWFDGGAFHRGYCSDYDIMLVWGEPGADQLKVFDGMRDIYREALTFWKPGRSISDISRDVLRVVEASGERDPLSGQFTGHNLGHEMVEKPWFGVGAAPDLLLEPGMVIAPEWFIETPYGPILFEENFLVGEGGLERLTDFPSKLQVIAN